jgi:hypothetical protein
MAVCLLKYMPNNLFLHHTISHFLSYQLLGRQKEGKDARISCYLWQRTHEWMPHGLWLYGFLSITVIYLYNKPTSNERRTVKSLSQRLALSLSCWVKVNCEMDRKLLQGTYCKVLTARYLLQGTCCKVPAARYLLQGTYCKVPAARYLLQGTYCSSPSQMAYQVSSPHFVDSTPNNFTAWCRPTVVPVDKIITRVFQHTSYHFQENKVLCASFTLVFELSFTVALRLSKRWLSGSVWPFG